MGIYNFANNKETLMYLYNHQNTYKDVAHIHQLGNENNGEGDGGNKKHGLFDNNFKSDNIVRTAKVLGFKNVTASAGATTLIYILKKSLSEKDYVVAIEVNKNDFGFFNEKDMYSVSENNLEAAINKFGTANMILVDLNNVNGDMNHGIMRQYDLFTFYIAMYCFFQGCPTAGIVNPIIIKAFFNH